MFSDSLVNCSKIVKCSKIVILKEEMKIVEKFEKRKTKSRQSLRRSILGMLGPKLQTCLLKCLFLVSILLITVRRGGPAGAGVTFQPDPTDWNRYMHALNGNIVSNNKLTARNRELGIFHQNIPQWCDLEEVGLALGRLLKVHKPHLLFIGEADPLLVEANCPPDYSFVRGNLSGASLVRICLLIRNNIKFKVLKVASLVPIVGVQVGTWKLYSVYREWSHGRDPRTNTKEGWNERFSDLISKWKEFKGNSLVIGDMNFDPIAFSAYQKKFEFLREMVRSEITDRGWTQLIDKPTRFQKNNKPSCIDHIYVNNNKSTIRTWNDGIIGQDHNCIGIKLKTDGKVFKSETIRVRPLKDLTVDTFKDEWETGHPEEILQERKDPDVALERLEHKIVRVLEHVCPEKVIKTKPNYSPWYTREHAKLSNDRDRMHKLAKLYNTNAAWAAFKRFKNMVRNRMKKDKRVWTNAHLVTATSDKQRWNRLKALAGLEKKKGLADMEIVTDDKKVISEPAELATHMNEYFKQKVVNLQKNLKVDIDACVDYAKEFVRDRVTKPEDLSFRFQTVGTGEIARVIKSLTNTGATGRDSISTEVIKKYSEVLAPYIRHVVNLAITKSKYCTGWKWGVITPLPKAGDLSISKNWRPVVINPSLSKIFEKVINSQMTKYMEENSLYSPSQHAYREKRSCLSCLLDIDSVIQDARNRGKNAALVLTDMSAAFNLISKEVLVPLMSEYGFVKSATDLVNSYLTGRKTQCKVKNKVSPPTVLQTGVGEGSVIGPNFFIMATCSVSMVARRVERTLREKGITVEIRTQEFADDTSSLIVADTDEDLQIAVEEMMKGFEHYFNSAGLCLNQSKCETIVFRSKRKTKTIVLPCGDEEKKVIKLLGLWFDNDYSFRTHADKVVQKVNFKLANLARVRPYLDDEDMRKYAESLVLSVINYCAELYLRPVPIQKRIQKCLNRVMRLVLNAPLRTHIDDLIQILQWHNASNLYRFSIVTAMRRLIKTGMAPVSFRLHCEAKRTGHYHLRTQDCPLPWTRMNCHARNSFLAQAAYVYNELNLYPQYFSEENQDKSFKLHCKMAVRIHFGNGKL